MKFKFLQYAVVSCIFVVYAQNIFCSNEVARAVTEGSGQHGSGVDSSQKSPESWTVQPLHEQQRVALQGQSEVMHFVLQTPSEVNATTQAQPVARFVSRAPASVGDVHLIDVHGNDFSGTSFDAKPDDFFSSRELSQPLMRDSAVVSRVHVTDEEKVSLRTMVTDVLNPILDDKNNPGLAAIFAGCHVADLKKILTEISNSPTGEITQGHITGLNEMLDSVKAAMQDSQYFMEKSLSSADKRAFEGILQSMSGLLPSGMSVDTNKSSSLDAVIKKTFMTFDGVANQRALDMIDAMRISEKDSAQTVAIGSTVAAIVCFVAGCFCPIMFIPCALFAATAAGVFAFGGDKTPQEMMDNLGAIKAGTAKFGAQTWKKIADVLTVAAQVGVLALYVAAAFSGRTSSYSPYGSSFAPIPTYGGSVYYGRPAYTPLF